MGRTDIIRFSRLAAVLMAGASLAACASIEPRYATRGDLGGPAPNRGGSGYKVGQPYQVNGVWYYPKEQPNYDQVGVASWYGDAFHMKPTANGETFDMNAVSAAHTTLPLPSIVEVTNLENGRKLKVRVNDRGPFVGDRIIDLSHEAARELGYDRQGLAKVRVRYIGPAPITGPGPGLLYAQAKIPPAASKAPSLAETRREQAAFANAAPVTTAQYVARPAEKAPIVLASSLPAAARAPVTGHELPPLGPQVRSTPAQPGPTVAAPEPATSATADSFRIQAGAFSQEANARKAVDELSPEGSAFIEPMQRNGVTLYKVVLPAPADEAEAYALRDRVAAIGFADARVVRAF